MNKKIRLTFYYIFLLCAFFGIVLFSKVDSYASVDYYFLRNASSNSVSYDLYNFGSTKVCLYKYGNNKLDVCSLTSSLDVTNQYVSPEGNVSHHDYHLGYVSTGSGVYRFNQLAAISYGHWELVETNMPVYDTLTACYEYLSNNSDIYHADMELDSFKVSSWGLGTSQLAFNSKFEATWSDSRIATVQVRIAGPNRIDTFESSSSPFKGKFKASNYVNVNGDVIHVTATPFKSDGSYGKSLYYTFIYDDNIPFSNVYRKFFNTPYSDNTLTIPYTGVSGNGDGTVTAPVEYVTTNNNYEVHYNPTTNEYTDIYLTEIYYSPVIIYPSDTPEDVVDDTQDTIINEYTTNNYYETTKNINVDFDVSFGDVSTGDIQIGYDNFGGFINGIGGLVTKLASWVNALFPFISPTVAATIIIVFGLVTLLAIVVFALKIADVIADFLDIIVPL